MLSWYSIFSFMFNYYQNKGVIWVALCLVEKTLTFKRDRRRVGYFLLESNVSSILHYILLEVVYIDAFDNICYCSSLVSETCILSCANLEHRSSPNKLTSPLQIWQWWSTSRALFCIVISYVPTNFNCAADKF